MDVLMPNGKTITDVPEGTTQAQLAALVPADWLIDPNAPKKEPDFWQRVSNFAGEAANDVAKGVKDYFAPHSVMDNYKAPETPAANPDEIAPQSYGLGKVPVRKDYADKALSAMQDMPDEDLAKLAQGKGIIPALARRQLNLEETEPPVTDTEVPPDTGLPDVGGNMDSIAPQTPDDLARLALQKPEAAPDRRSFIEKYTDAEKAALLNLAGGLYQFPAGLGKIAATIVGDEDRVRKIDEVSRDIQSGLAENYGGDTIAGRATQLLGAIAPAIIAGPGADAGLLENILSNAGMFALPAFNDTLKAKLDALDQPKNEEEAKKNFVVAAIDAARTFALNSILPSILPYGVAPIGKVLGAEGAHGVKAAIVGGAQTIAEGAGFSAANSISEKLTDMAFDVHNDHPWIDPKDAAVMIVAFGATRALRAAPDMLPMSKAARLGKTLNENIDNTSFDTNRAAINALNPDNAQYELRPNDVNNPPPPPGGTGEPPAPNTPANDNTPPGTNIPAAKDALTSLLNSGKGIGNLIESLKRDTSLDDTANMVQGTKSLEAAIETGNKILDETPAITPSVTAAATEAVKLSIPGKSTLTGYSDEMLSDLITSLRDNPDPFRPQMNALALKMALKEQARRENATEPTQPQTPADAGVFVSAPEIQAASDNAKKSSFVPFAKRVASTDARLADPVQRAELDGMKSEFGWSEAGGRIIRGQDGEVTGRTSWVPLDDRLLWQRRPDKNVSEAEARKFVDDALAGNPLPAKGHRFINYLLDVSDERGRQLSDVATETKKAEDELSPAEFEALDALMVNAENVIGSDAYNKIVSRLEGMAETNGVRAWHDALTFALKNDIENKEALDAQRTGQTSRAAAGVAGEGGQTGRTETGIDRNTQAFSLNHPTEEDLRQQEAAREQAWREEEAYIRAQAAERGARDQADIDARTEARTANPDNFQFGESSKDAAKPMGDLFNQPAKPAAESKLPPTDIRIGDNLLLDGDLYTVTAGIKGGVKAERKISANQTSVRLVYGDDAIRSKLAAEESKPTQEQQAGFDSAAWNKARNDRIEASREAGNVHLDKVPVTVETMRGREISYVHDPKEHGVIRTVDNRGSVMVHWSDKYSADKEMATEKKEGKKTVFESWLAPTDLKDYFFTKPAEAAKAEQLTQEQQAAAILKNKTVEQLQDIARRRMEDYNASNGKDQIAKADSAAAIEEINRRKKAEYESGMKLAQEADQATAILDRANVTGKERLDIMRDFRDGKHTLADLEAAYPAAEEAPKPAASGAKEPWQMTRAEYIEQHRAVRSKEADIAIAEAEALPDDWHSGIWNKTNNLAQIKQRFADRSAENLLDLQSYKNGHKNDVKRAIEAGKPVPPEVLADYPDLAKQEQNDRVSVNMAVARQDRDTFGLDKSGQLSPSAVRNVRTLEEIMSRTQNRPFVSERGNGYVEISTDPKDGKMLTLRITEKAVSELAEQPTDDLFHYTNGNMGMTSSGSFTADKSRWITFTRDEALSMGARDAKPAYATKRGLFVGVDSGERVKQATEIGAPKFSIRTPISDNRAEQVRLLQDKLDTDRADAELRYETGDRVDPDTGDFYGGGGAGYSRGRNSEANNFKTNEANREQTDALEETIRRGGHDFTVTPVSLPFDLAARGDSEYNAAQKIARIFGKKVVWMRADGEFPINGVIDTANPKSIFIDVRSAIPTHSVLGHELTHHMEVEAPEVYADLVNTLNGIIRGHDDYRAQNGIPAEMSDRGVTKEIVGDLMGDSFRDPAFWDRVGQQNPTVLGRIADVVRKWLNNLILRATGKGYGSEQFVTDAKTAREALAKAVAEYATSAHEKAAGEGKPLFDTEREQQDRFYSQLRRAMRDAPDKIFGNADQVKLWLDGNASKLGVKKDELYWSGINDYLAMQKGKVSKADVLNYLDQNGVQVKEVMLGTDIKAEYKKVSESEYKNDYGYSIKNKPTDTGKKYSEPNWGIYDDKGGLLNDGYWSFGQAENAAKEEFSDYVKTADTKHGGGNLVLPGGTDYKEMVLIAPQAEKWGESDTTHYGDTGEGRTIGWTRYDTRTDAQGRTGTLIEEIQSKRGQAGRSGGFGQEQYKAEQRDGVWGVFTEDGEFRPQESELEAINVAKRLNEYSNGQGKGVPPAPWISDANNKATNAYITLLLKKQISAAIDAGHDFVAWTTGKQQADRYSLSKQIDSVSWTEYPSAGKDHGVLVATKDGKQVIKETIPRSELGDHIGKAVAEKLLAQKDDIGGRKTLEGVNMDIGGEWAHSMYGDESGLDQNGKPALITQAANDILKRLGGGKVESVDFPAARLEIGNPAYASRQPSFTITPELKTKVLGEGMTLFSKSRAVTQDEFDAKQEQKGVTGLVEESRSAAGKIKDGLGELYDAWKATPKYGDMERIKGNLTGKNQEVDFDVDRMFKKINLEIPATRQRAIKQYMQAGGDEALLKERITAMRAKGIAEKYIQPFEDALRLPDSDKTAAKTIYAEQQHWGEKAVDAGILEHLLDNYVRGQWERESQGGQRLAALANSGILNEHPREAMRKVFQNDFEGLMAGFVPADQRIGYQHGMAQAAIRKAINAHEALRDMMSAKAADGMPITMIGAGGVRIVENNENVIARRAEVQEARKALEGDPQNKALQKALDAKRDALDAAVKAGEADLKDKAYFVKPNMPPKGAVTADGRSYVEYDHPALRRWKWAGEDAAGNPVFMRGNMWIHPDAVKDIHALLGRSAIRDYAIPESVPVIGGTHPGAAALKASAYVKATILAAVPVPFHLTHVSEHAVFHDVNPLDTRPLDFDRAVTIGGKEYYILREMVNHGGMLYGHNALQEFGEGLSSGGLFKHIPYWGEMVHRFGEWQFKEIIPRLKAEMFEKAVLRDVAHSQKDLASGKITMDQIFQRQAKHSNDAFGEQNYKYIGRNPTVQDAFKLLGLAPDFLESRMKFAGAALTPSGREQRIALIKGALIMGIGAQIINLMFGDDHKTHWDRPFSVIIGGREYTPRSVVGDIVHLYNDPRSWFYSRINPLMVRPGVELAFGRNQFGQKETTVDAMENIIKSWSPIPAQGLYKSTQGQTQLQAIVGQLLQSIGISNKQAKTPAEKLISDINFDKRPAGIESAMTKKRYMEYGELKDDYMSGKLNSMDDVRRQAKADGVILSRNQLDAIRRSRDTTPQAKEKILEAKMRSFSAAEAMMVWDKADPDERRLLKNFIRNKVNDSQTMLPQEKQAARTILNH